VRTLIAQGGEYALGTAQHADRQQAEHQIIRLCASQRSRQARQNHLPGRFSIEVGLRLRDAVIAHALGKALQFFAPALPIKPFAIRADWTHAPPRVEQEFDRRPVDALVEAREIDGLAQMLDVGRLEQNRHRTAKRLRLVHDDASHRGHRVGLTLRVEKAGDEKPRQVFELGGRNMHRGRMVRTCPARVGSSFGHNGGRFGSTFIAGKRVLFMSSTKRFAPSMSRTPSFTTSGTTAAATRAYPNATPRPPSGLSMRQKRACSSCASAHLHASAVALAAVAIKWRRVSGMTLLVRLLLLERVECWLGSGWPGIAGDRLRPAICARSEPYRF